MCTSQMGNKTAKHFEELLIGYVKPLSMQDIRMFETCITDDQNIRLVRLPTGEKILEAIKG